MGDRTRATAGDADLRVELTTHELRVVVRFAVQHAEEVLAVVEEALPDDPRPRAAIEAAWVFVNGAPRSAVQRTTALDAHRSARSAPSEVAALAARAAGDAAAAAYLHPVLQATQVGHILRAAAIVARIREIEADDDHAVGDAMVCRSRRWSTPELVDVLRRYPPAPGGTARVAQLMQALDHALRQGTEQSSGHPETGPADEDRTEAGP